MNVHNSEFEGVSLQSDFLQFKSSRSRFCVTLWTEGHTQNPPCVLEGHAVLVVCPPTPENIIIMLNLIILLYYYYTILPKKFDYVTFVLY